MTMPDMIAIEDLLQDHQWHKVDLKPLTKQQIALCLRKDGRLLLMDEKQFDWWARDDLLRNRLDDMARGRGEQVEGDTQHEALQESNTESKIGELAIGTITNMMDIGPDQATQLHIAFQEMMQMSPMMAQVMGGDVQSFMQNIRTRMPEGEASMQDTRKNREDVEEVIVSTMKVEDAGTAEKDSVISGSMLKNEQLCEVIKECNPAMSDEEVRNMARQLLLEWQQQATAAAAGSFSSHSKKSRTTTAASRVETSEKIDAEAPGRHKILPPCYCVSCSKYFWNHVKDGFPRLLDQNLAASQVQGWVENTMAKSQSITQALARHEQALRRRWTKKHAGQRRQILTKACPSLMTYKGLEALLAERSPGQKRSRLTKPGRRSILTSILILDELIEDPNLLFEHLHDRTQHPSRHFLADFMRVESAALYKDLLEHPYIFGAFQITNDPAYGKWREWEDGPIHRFEAVAAPYSVLVFESQSHILDALSEVVLRVTEGLPPSAGQEQKLLSKRCSSDPQPLSLPSLDGIGSLYTTFPQLQFSFEIAHETACSEAFRALSIMKNLRADNFTFTERMRSCQALRNATRVLTPGTSQNALVASLILAVPHDRLVSWMNITHQFKSLQEAEHSKADYLTGGQQSYIHAFKTLTAMLFHRFYQLTYLAEIFCANAVTPEALIPAGFLNGRWTARSWLREYFFGPPTQPIRIMALRYLQVRFEQQQEDVRFMNDLIKEWLDEVLAIRRVLEILQACEPTVRQYFLEPFDGPQNMWYNMCPNLSVGHYEDSMEDRGEELDHLLRPLAEYTLPTGCRDATWHAKKVSAEKLLRDTWSRYEKATVGYWKRQKFKPSWLNVVRFAMAATEPEKAPDAPPLVSEPRSPSKKQVISSPMTPTSIPHQHVPEAVSERKLTRKKRDELNPPAEDEDEKPSAIKAVEVLTTQQAALTVTDIPIRETHLEVVISLFSNAQRHVTSVRWNKFLNFMRDAGCEVKSSEGSGYTFSSRNVITGARATVVLHRPHPDATLKAVHLRNAKSSIVDGFGWQQEMFVVRK